MGDLIWNRLTEGDIEVNADIKVQTYFIAARLVAQGVGDCVVDKYTAQGNLADNTTVASFDPPLHFPTCIVHLENRPLSTLATAFVATLKEVMAKL
ncbi:MAG: LysR substrate-binding domain-containing protein [Psychrosphaera sp.]|nr:LysR substrate-binding domain-containing protein [Psychrosphaera sp.]